MSENRIKNFSYQYKPQDKLSRDVQQKKKGSFLILITETFQELHQWERYRQFWIVCN